MIPKQLNDLRDHAMSLVTRSAPSLYLMFDMWELFQDTRPTSTWLWLTQDQGINPGYIIKENLGFRWQA